MYKIEEWKRPDVTMVESSNKSGKWTQSDLRRLRKENIFFNGHVGVMKKISQNGDVALIVGSAQGGFIGFDHSEQFKADTASELIDLLKEAIA